MELSSSKGLFPLTAKATLNLGPLELANPTFLITDEESAKSELTGFNPRSLSLTTNGLPFLSFILINS